MTNKQTPIATKPTQVIIFPSIMMLFPCTKEDIPNKIDENSLPKIISLEANRSEVNSLESVLIKCIASDPDDDRFEYYWSASGGSFNYTNLSIVNWIAPDIQYKQEYIITVVISDAHNNEAVTKQIGISVIPILPEIQEIVLYPTDDAWVSSGTPGSNYGYELSLNTGIIDFGIQEKSRYYSYLKFELSSLPENVTIEKAELVLLTNHSPTSQTIQCDVNIHNVPNSNWSEITLTYNNRPSSEDTVMGILRNVVFNQGSIQKISLKYSIDFSKLALSIMLHSYPAIEAPVTINDYCTFYSKDASTEYRPKLTIEYTMN